MQFGPADKQATWFYDIAKAWNLSDEKKEGLYVGRQFFHYEISPWV